MKIPKGFKVSESGVTFNQDRNQTSSKLATRQFGTVDYKRKRMMHLLDLLYKS